MARKTTTKPGKHYATDVQTEEVITLSEASATYGFTQDPVALRTIGLMGMQGKRDFANIKNENDFIGIIRAGIPKQAMTNIMDITDISLTEMAAITHTSDRTLRRYTPTQKLSQDLSERMIELAKLYTRGEEVFGTLEKFRRWMDTILLPLGNKKPKEFLDTSLGIGMIWNEIGRIEHGILA